MSRHSYLNAVLPILSQKIDFMTLFYRACLSESVYVCMSEKRGKLREIPEISEHELKILFYDSAGTERVLIKVIFYDATRNFFFSSAAHIFPTCAIAT